VANWVVSSCSSAHRHRRHVIDALFPKLVVGPSPSSSFRIHPRWRRLTYAPSYIAVVAAKLGRVCDFQLPWWWLGQVVRPRHVYSFDLALDVTGSTGDALYHRLHSRPAHALRRPVHEAQCIISNIPPILFLQIHLNIFCLWWWKAAQYQIPHALLQLVVVRHLLLWGTTWQLKTILDVWKHFLNCTGKMLGAFGAHIWMMTWLGGSRSGKSIQP